MSDAFLVDAAKRDVPETYAERRKKAINRSIERGAVKSRQQREQEAREEALARNMVDDSEQNSKALAMMMKMGFKPGQALGQKRPPLGEPREGDADAGAQRARSDSPRIRIDPIEVEMRQGDQGPGSFFCPLPPCASLTCFSPARSQGPRCRQQKGEATQTRSISIITGPDGIHGPICGARQGRLRQPQGRGPPPWCQTDLRGTRPSQGSTSERRFTSFFFQPCKWHLVQT
jgi:G-patch domain